MFYVNYISVNWKSFLSVKNNLCGVYDNHADSVVVDLIYNDIHFVDALNTVQGIVAIEITNATASLSTGLGRGYRVRDFIPVIIHARVLGSAVQRRINNMNAVVPYSKQADH